MSDDRALFEGALSVLQALVIQDDARVLLGGRGRVQIELRKGSSSKTAELADAHGVPPDDVERLAAEIADVLSACLAISREEFTEIRNTGRFGVQEEADLAAWKYDRVSEIFDLRELRGRLAVKSTALSDTPLSIEWHVVQSQARELESARLAEVEPPRFAEVRITTEKTTGYLPETNSVVFVADIEDVGYMIDSLQRLRGLLASAEPLQVGGEPDDMDVD